jgi:hypothetical protein
MVASPLRRPEKSVAKTPVRERAKTPVEKQVGGETPVEDQVQQATGGLFVVKFFMMNILKTLYCRHKVT